jgi:PRTRC genetic system ThiF family protein
MSGFVLKPNLTLAIDRNQPRHWVIVGAGGNGAYFIRDFMRQIDLQNRRLQIMSVALRHYVTIIDADEVEFKNLVRQNFISGDIGKNKAEVVATRYGRAFGTEISYINRYVESSEDLKQIATSKGSPPVFIGAVDNNKTRALIWNAWKEIVNAFWIDAGNEEHGGQVVCGYNYPKTATEDMASKPHAFYMPCVIDIYPEVAEATDKLPTELSCAEQSESAPQNIFTNLTAANLMMGFANIILTADTPNGEGLRCHAVAFNTKNLMSHTTRLNNPDLLQARYVAPEQAEFVEVPVTAEVAIPAKPRTKAKAAAVAAIIAATEQDVDTGPF